jgi:tetratricopeptide (TPR) repeat protein
VVLGVALVVAPAESMAAPPDPGDVATARQHFATASRLYDIAEFEDALREFKEAYRVVGDPAFLFNIAQCHRKLGHTQEAISFYRTYLRRAPEAKNREEVERHIAELERAAPPAAPAPVPVAPVVAPAAAPPAAPPPRPTEAALVARPEPAGAPAERPFYSRAWFWIVAGAVVAGAATAVVLVTRGDSAPGALCRDCATTTTIDPR